MTGPTKGVVAHCYARALGLAVAVGVSVEFLPVAFGTGYHARWDWSFLYVTTKFILLPIASLVLLLVLTPLTIMRGGTHLGWRTWTWCSVGGMYLIALFFHPEFWFV